MKVAIDISRSLSGGGKAHIIGILNEGEPQEFGISEVHVFGPKLLINMLPDKLWLVKHTPDLLNKNLLFKLFWQYFILPKEVSNNKCDVLLYTDAGTVGVFNPAIVMSRDMLSFEKTEISRYSLLSLMWWRLFLLRFIQIRSLKRASQALFLTNYAATTIQEWAGKIRDFVIIPHGISSHFTAKKHNKPWPKVGEIIKCLYVSNTALYKHQWKVLEAINVLRNKGHNLEIIFLGGGKGPSQQLFKNTKEKLDPLSLFSSQLPFINNKDLPAYILQSDIYVFASSCENMPNTLLEGMGTGIPIASSNRGPMPEILKDGGMYFDPEDSESITSAIEIIIQNPELRESIGNKAFQYAKEFSWKRCANETFRALYNVTKIQK